MAVDGGGSGLSDGGGVGNDAMKMGERVGIEMGLRIEVGFKRA